MLLLLAQLVSGVAAAERRSAELAVGIAPIQLLVTADALRTISGAKHWVAAAFRRPKHAAAARRGRAGSEPPKLVSREGALVAAAYLDSRMQISVRLDEVQLRLVMPDGRAPVGRSGATVGLVLTARRFEFKSVEETQVQRNAVTRGAAASKRGGGAAAAAAAEGGGPDLGGGRNLYTGIAFSVDELDIALDGAAAPLVRARGVLISKETLLISVTQETADELAREYGFASLPQGKTSVKALELSTVAPITVAALERVGSASESVQAQLRVAFAPDAQRADDAMYTAAEAAVTAAVHASAVARRAQETSAKAQRGIYSFLESPTSTMKKRLLSELSVEVNHVEVVVAESRGDASSPTHFAALSLGFLHVATTSYPLRSGLNVEVQLAALNSIGAASTSGGCILSIDRTSDDGGTALVMRTESVQFGDETYASARADSCMTLAFGRVKLFVDAIPQDAALLPCLARLIKFGRGAKEAFAPPPKSGATAAAVRAGARSGIYASIAASDFGGEQRAQSCMDIRIDEVDLALPVSSGGVEQIRARVSKTELVFTGTRYAAQKTFRFASLGLTTTDALGVSLDIISHQAASSAVGAGASSHAITGCFDNFKRARGTNAYVDPRCGRCDQSIVAVFSGLKFEVHTIFLRQIKQWLRLNALTNSPDEKESDVDGDDAYGEHGGGAAAASGEPERTAEAAESTSTHIDCTITKTKFVAPLDFLSDLACEFAVEHLRLSNQRSEVAVPTMVGNEWSEPFSGLDFYSLVGRKLNLFFVRSDAFGSEFKQYSVLRMPAVDAMLRTKVLANGKRVVAGRVRTGNGVHSDSIDVKLSGSRIMWLKKLSSQYTARDDGSSGGADVQQKPATHAAKDQPRRPPLTPNMMDAKLSWERMRDKAARRQAQWKSLNYGHNRIAVRLLRVQLLIVEDDRAFGVAGADAGIYGSARTATTNSQRWRAERGSPHILVGFGLDTSICQDSFGQVQARAKLIRFGVDTVSGLSSAGRPWPTTLLHPISLSVVFKQQASRPDVLLRRITVSTFRSENAPLAIRAGPRVIALVQGVIANVTVAEPDAKADARAQRDAPSADSARGDDDGDAAGADDAGSGELPKVETVTAMAIILPLVECTLLDDTVPGLELAAMRVSLETLQCAVHKAPSAQSALDNRLLQSVQITAELKVEMHNSRLDVPSWEDMVLQWPVKAVWKRWTTPGVAAVDADAYFVTSERALNVHITSEGKGCIGRVSSLFGSKDVAPGASEQLPNMVALENACGHGTFLIVRSGKEADIRVAHSELLDTSIPIVRGDASAEPKQRFVQVELHTATDPTSSDAPETMEIHVDMLSRMERIVGESIMCELVFDGVPRIRIQSLFAVQNDTSRTFEFLFGFGRLAQSGQFQAASEGREDRRMVVGANSEVCVPVAMQYTNGVDSWFFRARPQSRATSGEYFPLSEWISVRSLLSLEVEHASAAGQEAAVIEHAHWHADESVNCGDNMQRSNSLHFQTPSRTRKYPYSFACHFVVRSIDAATMQSPYQLTAVRLAIEVAARFENLLPIRVVLSLRRKTHSRLRRVRGFPVFMSPGDVVTLHEQIDGIEFTVSQIRAGALSHLTTA